MRSTIRAAFATMIVLSMIAMALPVVVATYPSSFGNDYPAMAPGWQTGTVTGRVTTQSTSEGLGGAYISIVNASNNSMEYSNTTADSLGYYQISGINATVNDNAYQVYANLSPYGDGLSHAFGVNSGATSATSVIIFVRPGSMSLQSEKTYVIADGSNNIKITAYVYDTAGKKVADGTALWFTIGNISSLPAWTYPNGTAMNGNNGSFSSYYSANNVTAYTKSGAATVQFGWVPDYAGGNNTTIHAYVASDPAINSSLKLYLYPLTASWTGYVVDSYGVGYGGITVTLHIRNATNGEIYNLTTSTSSAQPFVGLYVFDNIVPVPETAWAFADASAQLTDNITIYGRSNNYSLNKSSTSSGFIVLHVPPPDAIYVTADPQTILVGGDTSIITAQLYLNGQPYHRSNIRIVFSSDNDTVATLPEMKNNTSDLNGQATIPLTSNRTFGWVNVTAESNIMYGHNISNSTTVYVVGWGTVSGIVTDQNRVGIPYANVTLWNAVQNSSMAEQYDNVRVLKIPENPQQSNDGRTAAIGMYTFYRVSWGLYNVTAEKEGHTWYAVFTLGPGGDIGTATHNIAIPDYAYMPPAVETVTATPAPSQAQDHATPTPTPSASPGFEALIAIVSLAGIASLFIRKER